MILSDEIFTYTPELLKQYAGAKIVQLINTLLFGAAALLLLYIINAVALTKISKKLQFSNKYVAWIPLASPYIEGCILDRMKSQKLDKSHVRIHYTMLNIIYTIALGGSYFYSLFISLNQCMEMYNTGTIPLSIMSGTADPTYTAVSAVITVLGIVVAYFRMRTIFMAYVCFDKKKGVFWAIASSVVFPVLMPFFYLSLSKRSVSEHIKI